MNRRNYSILHCQPPLEHGQHSCGLICGDNMTYADPLHHSSLMMSRPKPRGIFCAVREILRVDLCRRTAGITGQTGGFGGDHRPISRGIAFGRGASFDQPAVHFLGLQNASGREIYHQIRLILGTTMPVCCHRIFCPTFAISPLSPALAAG